MKESQKKARILWKKWLISQGFCDIVGIEISQTARLKRKIDESLYEKIVCLKKSKRDNI